jgi:hypothetical protein
MRWRKALVVLCLDLAPSFLEGISGADALARVAAGAMPGRRGLQMRWVSSDPPASTTVAIQSSVHEERAQGGACVGVGAGAASPVVGAATISSGGRLFVFMVVGTPYI